MPENCAETCLVLPRVEALEGQNKVHSDTHREIFNRLRDLETISAVQENKLDTILRKLDALTAKVESLEQKPGKRWEAVVEKTVWAVCAALIAFLLGRIGI